MFAFNSWDEDNELPTTVGAIPFGSKRIDRPKQSTYYYHYTNESSQGALICGYLPDYFNPKTENYTASYSDRLYSSDAENYNKVCQSIGAFEQIWAYKLPLLSDKELKQFAKDILKLTVIPTYVRVVHFYNVATGYSCPVIEAIYSK